MRSRLQFFFSTILAALVLCASFSGAQLSAKADGAPSSSSRGGLFPDTTDNIHIEMVFNYELTQSQLPSETGVVDLVWGSSWATLPAGMYNTAYIPISVDNFTYSIKWYKNNHPDWLEYRCNRKTLAYEFGDKNHAPLDIANPDVQAFQWANWVDAPLAAGYQGIDVDTMDLTNDWQRCGHYDPNNNWVQQYTGNSDDPAFRADVLAWESNTYQHVHQQSDTATMQVNVSYQFGQPFADNRQLMTTTDLLFDERGFTNWGVPPNVPTPANWQTIVTQLKYVQSQGICYMTNGEESGLTANISQVARLWVIGNYLLVKNDCTYMYISGYTATGAQDYGGLITFPEYSIAIGSATDEMRKTQGIWERRFSNGLTMVNPYAATATVTLPAGNWVDVNGNSVGPTLILAGQTAQVLLVAGK
ncbi:MAG: putative glycoside hydrolase [Terriglobales bacterium]